MEAPDVSHAADLPDDDRQPAEIDVDALARGDAAALDAFYRELFEPVYAFAFWRVGGQRQDAEDVTQETFLIALRTIKSFERRASLQSWVCGIAKNLARARRRTHDRDDAPELDTVATEPLAESVVARGETQAIVGAALSELPPHYQRALVDKYVHDRSFEEMARAENRSAKAVESTVQRAKGALSAALRRLSFLPGDER
jgi:RNA polymerase sigma factor (sigma-70 family)